MADDSFRDFVLSQLEGLPNLRVKAMFGGSGLYQGDHFFGIVMDGRLYFKTNDESRGEYLKQNAKPFTYEKGKRIISMNYFEVSASVLEDRENLLIWARRAIQVTL